MSDNLWEWNMKLFGYCDHHVMVESYGNEISYDPMAGDFSNATKHIETLAKEMGAENVLLQLVANDKRGRFKVVPRNYLGRSDSEYVTVERDRVDGVILTKEGDAVAFMTRDCPTLVLYCTERDQFAVIHIWRNSVQGVDIGRPGESVIRNALRQCNQLWKNPDSGSIRGVITMGISALPFHNERNPEVVEYLRRRWGKRVAPQEDLFSPIDLRELVLAQLEMYGIKRTQVVCDSVDTFSNRLCASKRAGKVERHNLVVVLYKRKVRGKISPPRAPY